jgi:tRNA G10  N-methylase Trm11
MQYKFVKEQVDYSDLASGRVLHSLPGHPAFPVRLASEIFQRCIEHRRAIYKVSNPCTMYDPCCGTAYHLSVLGFLHGAHIRELIASDINEKVVEIARRNLELLRPTGMEERISELSSMHERYNKDSHRDALASAQALKIRITADHTIKTHAFQVDATNGKAILQNIRQGSVDIIFTDVPYGQHSQWSSSSNALWSMLDALLAVLSPTSILAIASDKGQKASHERYQRVEQFQLGKRRVKILMLKT